MRELEQCVVMWLETKRCGGYRGSGWLIVTWGEGAGRLGSPSGGYPQSGVPTPNPLKHEKGDHF